MLNSIIDQNWDLEFTTLNENDNDASIKRHFFVAPNGIQLDEPNKNKRIYIKKIMKPIINLYISEEVNSGGAYGEYDHPPNLIINPDRISHSFVEIKENGNYYSLKAEILDTPCGKILQSLIGNGTQKRRIGISTRGFGTLRETSEYNYITEDYQLVTAGDIVIRPSGQKAYIEGIYENIQYEYIDGQLIEHIKFNIRKNYKIVLPEKEKMNIFTSLFENLVKSVCETHKKI